MNKKLLSTVLAALVFAGGVAFAAVVVQEDGTVIDTTEKINFKNGPNVTDNGTVVDIDFSTQTGNQTVTGNLTVTGDAEVDGQIYADGSIYNAVLYVGNLTAGSALAGRVTLDPCGTLPTGTIFINGTTGAPCFCNLAGVDLSLYDGTTACF